MKFNIFYTFKRKKRFETMKKSKISLFNDDSNRLKCDKRYLI